jgi:hypothetical protein
MNDDIIDLLPSIVIKTEGRVIFSNLEPFRIAVMDMIDSIKTELVTDQDFADADAMAKHLKDGENRLKQAKAAALAQTVTLDALFRTADDMAELMRQTRLMLEKKVRSEEESRKAALVGEYASRLSVHESGLNVSMAEGYLAMTHKSAFADCIKGKSKLESMENALHSRLLELQYEATANATSIKNMLDAVEQAGVRHLFKDMDRLTCNPLDSEAMTALIASRKAEDDMRIAMFEERAAAQATAQAEAKAKREAEEAQRKQAEVERAAAQAKADEDMVAAQVLPIIPPVQNTDADLVREFMKKRGIDDQKTRAVLVEFVRYVRAHDAEKAA